MRTSTCNMKPILNFVVLTLCFAFLEGVKFRCDYRYTSLGWFKYQEIPATWHDAHLQCQLEGGVLAFPTTADMKSVMLELFCKPNQIFIGIHANFSKGHYYSIDGIPLAQIPYQWAPSEPDNKDNAESCLALNSDGKFSDVSCDEPRPYVCYREQSNVDVNVCGTTDPEYNLENQTNKCYKFHTIPRTFARAHFACSAEGGHLAIINSEEESKILSQIFAKYPESKMNGEYTKSIAFVGFLNSDKSTEWKTIHGQTLQEAGFATFHAGEPNNVGKVEYCGTVYRNGLLNDADCEANLAFICEKKPDYPPVCDVSEQNATIYNHFCKHDIQN